MHLLPSLAALAQVIIIDLSLAADNALVIGAAAAGLPKAERHRAVMIGLGGAVVIRIILACFAVKLLAFAGLTLAGGFLLLWVTWKMVRNSQSAMRISLKEWNLQHARSSSSPLVGEVRRGGARPGATSNIEDSPRGTPPTLPIPSDIEPLAGSIPTRGRESHRISFAGNSLAENSGQKNLRAAILEILAADLGMSLDNILGVAGAAHNHYAILAIGLILSVALTGAAATASAKLFHRFPWLGWIGIATVLYVAISMMASGVEALTK